MRENLPARGIRCWNARNPVWQTHARQRMPAPGARCMALCAAIAVLLAGCAARHDRSAGPTARAQLFDGMGAHQRVTSTTSPEAQAYFDQGLIWAYAFNHDEAIRSFERAAELDPEFGLAWWGVALCSGPHINNPAMSAAQSERAWRALEEAQRRTAGATPVERALIDALAARYAWPAPEDRGALDQAYADAMRAVYRQFPNDTDVGTLYAEALMDLQPWDLWTKQGEPKGAAKEIVRVLEHVMATDPRHPGAVHLYIHAVEASSSPQRASAAADTLRQLVPASSHLTHMPSHIDVRVGRWQEAAAANRRAIAADAAYRARSPRQAFYRVYMLHNAQFLSFVCMMKGRCEESLSAAKAALATVPSDWVKENAPVIDGYMIVHMEALKRFGKWKEILALPAPPEYLPVTTAMWRFNRAVALAAQGRIDQAERERERFLDARARVPETSKLQINPAERVLELAAHALDGEIAYARRDYAAATTALRAAIEIEDQLQYMEPPDWMLPVRHTLGAVLIDAGQYDEAARAYREDLEYWPENGWSLLGLTRAYEKQGRTELAAQTRSRFALAWSGADVQPHASCLCAPTAR
jgi:tetratricopeptide (TPR) repeat protein